MATDYALGERRKAAMRRIQAAIAGDSDYTLELPKRSQYGQAVLLVQQLELLADYIEKAPVPETPTVTISAPIPEKYLRAEQLAREGATKAAIVEALVSEESEAENAPAL
jgi:hypothetical protein